ncbi:MAG: type I methionyl aminopeptidase [Eubacterium sp.]|nr:type I methionyl aminopeptidase [Eubacterium sp.]MCI8919850.1 type I methionyl aminopeptidase [Eubacterium sp.]
MRAAVKSAKEIELMRAAGRILGRVHKELAAEIEPGMSTLDIDRICEELIRSYGCIPSFLNYQGFPASVCVSVNDEVVHGIPKKDRIVKEGDIVSLDTGVIYKGYQSDAARTIGIGSISKQAADLIEHTKLSFFAGMRYARAGGRLFDISSAIGNYAQNHGYGVVRDLVGHGIGRHMHEPPEIPNYPQRFRGMRLLSGMTLAVEPMINIGTWRVRWQDNGWTAVTADGSLSAHYENTILITAAGPEFLSVTEEEERQLNQIAAAQPMVKCKNPILKVNEWRNGNVKSRCN